jgi:hypothetical protein
VRFRLHPGHSWGDLVTAIVSREDHLWTVSSWIDGRLEAGGDFQTLDDLVQVADALVRESYPSGPRRTTAELQYAIYPWTFKGNPDAILDVTVEGGDLVAADIRGSNFEVRGKTAEDLVEQASSALGEQPQPMLRWIKKIGDLTDT